MLHIGLDVHSRMSSLCILDSHGKVVKRLEVKGHPSSVIQRLRRLEEPFVICFEASTSYGWLYDELRPIAQRVVVAHPGKLRLIFRSKRKNDRKDAERLAKLLYLDEVPEVHVPPAEVRQWRQIIEQRRRTVAERTRVKNRIRALLRTHGIHAPRGGSLWTTKGRQWLAELAFEGPFVALQRDELLIALGHLETTIRRFERTLNEYAAKHPGVQLLQSIPGIGPRTAEAFVAYVDDPHRFKAKSIGAYLGIVPSQDASADRNRLGRITKDGPSSVRAFLTEAVWQAMRRSVTIRAYFERICGGMKDRRKKAVVAVGHYLARIMLAMLRTGQPWEEKLAG